MSFAKPMLPRTMALPDSFRSVLKGTTLLNFASAYPGNSAGVGLLLLRLLLGFSGFQEAWLLRSGDRSTIIIELELSFGILAVALLVGWRTRLAACLFFFTVAMSTLWVGHDLSLTHFNRFIMSLFPAGIALALALLGPGFYSIDARLFGRHEIIIEPIDRNR